MERSATVQPLPENLAGNLSKGYHFREGTYNAQNFEWVSNAPSAPAHATAITPLPGRIEPFHSLSFR